MGVKPPLRNFRRFRAMVLTVVTGVQLPGVAAAAHLTGSWLLAIGGATAITLPYVLGLRSPFEDKPKSALYRYFGLWPFFAWWTSCLAFAVLAPLALLPAWALHLPTDPILTVAGGLALLLGIDSTRRAPRVV